MQFSVLHMYFVSNQSLRLEAVDSFIRTTGLAYDPDDPFSRRVSVQARLLDEVLAGRVDGGDFELVGGLTLSVDTSNRPAGPYVMAHGNCRPTESLWALPRTSGAAQASWGAMARWSFDYLDDLELSHVLPTRHAYGRYLASWQSRDYYLGDELAATFDTLPGWVGDGARTAEEVEVAVQRMRAATPADVRALL